MKKTLADFDQYINQALQDWHIPGAAVAVIKGDEVLHQGGYGFRDIEKRLPVTENTRFPIASMTKAFTVMGVALLVDEGLLDWDQPIRDVMPDFRLADDYATQHATLRDLLSHRTGLPRHDAAWYGSDKGIDEIFPELRHLKPTAAFRSAWQYNNLMYETAGLLCVKVSGVSSWYEFIQTRILTVLGMHDSIPKYKKDDEDNANIALPYRLKNGETTPQKIPFYDNPLGPAGSIYSTLKDITTWLKVHTHAGQHNGQPFVSPYGLQQMHTPHMLMPATAAQQAMFNNNLYSYGMGWFIEPYKGVTLIHHGGNIDGFSVMGAFVPQEQLAIAILTNVDGKGLRTALMYEALDRALGVEGKDWSQEILKRNNETVTAALKANEQTAAESVVGVSPSHDLADYVGSYEQPGYCDIDIKLDGSELQAKFYGAWWPFIHCHYDVFEIDMSSRHDEKLTVSFSLDNHGIIHSINVPIEPDIGDSAFTRKPIVLTNSEQEKWVGSYDYPIEGQGVDIGIKDKTLYLTITGQPAKALSCVQKVQHKLSFKIVGNEQSLLECIDDAQGNRKLVIKHPGATYDCPYLDN